MADSSKDLTTLINRVIFHDVPNNSKVGSASPLTGESTANALCGDVTKDRASSIDVEHPIRFFRHTTDPLSATRG